MRVVLDTNFLYAFLVKNDVHNEDASEIFLSFPDFIEFVVPNIVVAELLASGESIDFISECFKLTQKFEEIQLRDLEFMKTLSVRMRRSLKANDCLILAISKRMNAKLVTFDHRLIKVSKTIL